MILSTDSQGTQAGGNRFPGVVAAPFAMVKLGPDVESGRTDAYSGYLPSGNIWGFSMMHESGTGGAPKYGVVSQMPVIADISNPTANFSQPRASPDEADVGYYKSALANGVTVELAASEHAGLYSYIFPKGSTPSIVVDVSHVLPSFRGLGWEQHYSRGELAIAENGQYVGSGTYNVRTVCACFTCEKVANFTPMCRTAGIYHQTGQYTSVASSTNDPPGRTLSSRRARKQHRTTDHPVSLAKSASVAYSRSMM
jgi:putative alpha-1,2-mannosidase